MPQDTSQTSTTYTAIDQQFAAIKELMDTIQQVLSQTRLAALPGVVYDGANQISKMLKQVRKKVNTLEEERRSLRALAQIGHYVNSSLELDVVLKLVMDTIIRLSGAERGFLMLRDEKGEMAIRVARNWVQESIDPSELTISKTIINHVGNTGLPILTNNAQDDHRFSKQESIVEYNLRSILCVPLKTKDQVTGVIYADNRVRSGIFSQRELDMLSTFANQASVAIENATLYASIRRTLSEVIDLKNLMDNVFSSIPSGVITTDINERVLMCNQAAANIIGSDIEDILGRDIHQVLSPMIPVLDGYLERAIRLDQMVLGIDTITSLPGRDLMDLRISLSPLKDAHQSIQGVTIVLEDLTDKKKLEAQRRLFERMVSPAVIDQLDPDSLELGGKRAEITALFADIHNFTRFSESIAPEELVQVLNRYLAVCAEAILNEGGTIDKFQGDAVIVWWNAPIQQPDHTLRAVRAALAMRASIKTLHESLPEQLHLSLGIGIHVGEAVLGLVGTKKRLEYTAIGDCINITKRLQEHAGPDQILISYQAYARVARKVVVSQVEPITAKGKRNPLVAYRLVQLR
jgi:adenylate cyclase